jgi:hypothetical protein
MKSDVKCGFEIRLIERRETASTVCCFKLCHNQVSFFGKKNVNNQKYGYQEHNLLFVSLSILVPGSVEASHFVIMNAFKIKGQNDISAWLEGIGKGDGYRLSGLIQSDFLGLLAV